MSADTLVYFGDLGEVAPAAARALRPAGALVFTVEAAEPASAPAGFRINPHGRYSHTQAYVGAALSAAGLATVAVERVVLRMELGVPVDGILVCVGKP